MKKKEGDNWDKAIRQRIKEREKQDADFNRIKSNPFQS